MLYLTMSSFYSSKNYEVSCIYDKEVPFFAVGSGMHDNPCILRIFPYTGQTEIITRTKIYEKERFKTTNQRLVR